MSNTAPCTGCPALGQLNHGFLGRIYTCCIYGGEELRDSLRMCRSRKVVFGDAEYIRRK
jgi:hypothetical protein